MDAYKMRAEEPDSVAVGTSGIDELLRQRENVVVDDVNVTRTSKATWLLLPRDSS